MVDRKDGRADPVGAAGQLLGDIYKFPFHTEKKDYQYYDRDLRRPLPIKFRGTDAIRGIEVYRFEQVISNETQNINADSMNALASRASRRRPPARASCRTATPGRMWVEPVTGQFLRAREVQRKELVPNTGERTVLLDATFTYTDQTTTEAAARAEDNAGRLGLVSTTGPIAAAGAGYHH